MKLACALFGHILRLWPIWLVLRLPLVELGNAAATRHSDAVYSPGPDRSRELGLSFDGTGSSTAIQATITSQPVQYRGDRVTTGERYAHRAAIQAGDSIYTAPQEPTDGYRCINDAPRGARRLAGSATPTAYESPSPAASAAYLTSIAIVIGNDNKAADDNVTLLFTPDRTVGTYTVVGTTQETYDCLIGGPCRGGIFAPPGTQNIGTLVGKHDICDGIAFEETFSVDSTAISSAVMPQPCIKGQRASGTSDNCGTIFYIRIYQVYYNSFINDMVAEFYFVGNSADCVAAPDAVCCTYDEECCFSMPGAPSASMTAWPSDTATVSLTVTKTTSASRTVSASPMVSVYVTPSYTVSQSGSISKSPSPTISSSLTPSTTTSMTPSPTSSSTSSLMSSQSTTHTMTLTVSQTTTPSWSVLPISATQTGTFTVFATPTTAANNTEMATIITTCTSSNATNMTIDFDLAASNVATMLGLPASAVVYVGTAVDGNTQTVGISQQITVNNTLFTFTQHTYVTRASCSCPWKVEFAYLPSLDTASLGNSSTKLQAVTQRLVSEGRRGPVCSSPPIPGSPILSLLPPDECEGGDSTACTGAAGAAQDDEPQPFPVLAVVVPLVVVGAACALFATTRRRNLGKQLHPPLTATSGYTTSLRSRSRLNAVMAPLRSAQTHHTLAPNDAKGNMQFTAGVIHNAGIRPTDIEYLNPMRCNVNRLSVGSSGHDSSLQNHVPAPTQSTFHPGAESIRLSMSRYVAEQSDPPGDGCNDQFAMPLDQRLRDEDARQGSASADPHGGGAMPAIKTPKSTTDPIVPEGRSIPIGTGKLKGATLRTETVKLRRVDSVRGDADFSAWRQGTPADSARAEKLSPTYSFTAVLGRVTSQWATGNAPAVLNVPR